MIRRYYLMRHPAVVLIYFVGAAGLAMSTYEPACTLLSLFGASLSLFMLRGARAWLKTGLIYLLMIFLVAAVNPFFSQRGLTVLFYVGGTPYTVEAFLYGFSAGMSMVAAIEWLNALFLALPSGRFLALFSKPAPITSSLISMIFRYMPELMRKSRLIMDARKGLGLDSTDIRGALAMSGALFSWSLEDSVETADSMRARDYGKAKRTSAYDLSLSFEDRLELVILCVLLACGILTAVRAGDFLFYPRIRFVSFGPEILGYVAYVFLPLFCGLGTRINESVRILVSLKARAKADSRK